MPSLDLSLGLTMIGCAECPSPPVRQAISWKPISVSSSLFHRCDEPEILSYPISSICPKGDDGRHLQSILDLVDVKRREVLADLSDDAIVCLLAESRAQVAERLRRRTQRPSVVAIGEDGFVEGVGEGLRELGLLEAVPVGLGLHGRGLTGATWPGAAGALRADLPGRPAVADKFLVERGLKSGAPSLPAQDARAYAVGDEDPGDFFMIPPIGGLGRLSGGVSTPNIYDIRFGSSQSVPHPAVTCV
jgi:hypothetical protein